MDWLSPLDGDSPTARGAAQQLMAGLRAGHIAPGVPTSVLYGADGGKMFGVLLVRTAQGSLGYLKAFSGQLERRWDVEGFVPPLFDRAARLAIEPRGEASVRGFTARVLAARTSAAWAQARSEAATLAGRHAREEAELRARHQLRKEDRAVRRRQLEKIPPDDPARELLNQAAREDETEHRSLKARLRAERAPFTLRLARFERRLRRIEQLRVAASRIVSWQLYDTYVLENALGERRTLRELFAPTAPPSGAGDCAAPKLIVHARQHGLTPLALAEFWWGLPPRGGGREEGVFYPACPEKCGTVLPFLLRGTNGVA